MLALTHMTKPQLKAEIQDRRSQIREMVRLGMTLEDVAAYVQDLHLYEDMLDRCDEADTDPDGDIC